MAVRLLQGTSFHEKILIFYSITLHFYEKRVEYKKTNLCVITV